jgi:hypothetical protein
MWESAVSSDAGVGHYYRRWAEWLEVRDRQRAADNREVVVELTVTRGWSAAKMKKALLWCH